MPQPVLVRSLGVQDYQLTWEQMRQFTDSRTPDTQDELWLVQHPPVFTLGQAGRQEHVLAPGDIPVVQCDRGGQVTYHGPGQLIAYPLLNLPRLKVGVRELVEKIEQVLINTVKDYGIEAERMAGAPGVYVNGAKIAALGLRVRRGCSFHGLSLNVAMDLEPFQRINPCGYAGMAVTQMSDLSSDDDLSLDDVSRALVRHCADILDLSPRWAEAPDWIQTDKTG
ncbi:lipoyl(octanoyl) transferase LipB [Aurantivibrio plasticivorans]